MRDGRSDGGWAKAPEGWAHSRTLSRGRKIAGARNLAGLGMAAGCQPAIQPIANRRYLAFPPANDRFHHFRTCKPVNYWGAHRRSRISPPMASIPKGLRHLAQGCEARATLGNRAKIVSNPNRGFALSPAPRHVRPRPKPKAQSLPFPFPAQYRSA